MSPYAEVTSTGDELAMYNSSVWLEPQFGGSQVVDEECPAMNGCNYMVGRLEGGRSRSASVIGGVKRKWWQISTATTSGVTFYVQSALFFLATMMVLGALRNILSIGNLAVLGGQEWLVTGLNLVFGVFFWFKQQQKQQQKQLDAGYPESPK